MIVSDEEVQNVSYYRQVQFKIKKTTPLRRPPWLAISAPFFDVQIARRKGS